MKNKIKRALKYKGVQGLGNTNLTVGKCYPCDIELSSFSKKEIFVIRDDSGSERRFTTKPDESGLSYANWFDFLLVEGDADVQTG